MVEEEGLVVEEGGRWLRRRGSVVEEGVGG